MQVLRSHEEIRDVNIRYHDVAAAGYDAKWGIDYGTVGQGQVVGKVRKLLGEELERGFGRALEIGSGTGYFGLNLLQAGVVGQLTCTDIAPGMVEALTRNAQLLGLSQQVSAVRADADALPFADASFDIVIGHAVLHHLPDLPRAFQEFRRVLKPGGRIVFAGEPSRIGDRLARVPKGAAGLLAPAWRRLVGAEAASEGTTGHDGSDAQPGAQHDPMHHHALEREVDIHAFMPGDLADLATQAGFVAVKLRGEELIANWFGWFNRGLEATAVADQVPMLWRRYAFRGYLLLQRLDERALESRLPPALFYNLLLTACTP